MPNSDEPKDNLENKKALNVTLSIQWSKDDNPNRRNYILETTLQTWASNPKNAAEGRLTCEVLGVSADGRVVQMSIKPPPDLSKLVALKGQALPRKDGKTLKVMSVSWEGDDAQIQQEGVMKAPSPPPPEPQHERAPVNEEGCAGPPAAVFMAGNECLFLPVDMFLALSHSRPDEVRCIEKRNNCVMKAKVKVEFVKGEGEGDPQKALSEFKAFIQCLVCPPHGSVAPPGRPDPEELDTWTRIDKPEEDVQLAQSSLEQLELTQSKKTVLFSAEVPEASLWTSQSTAGDVKMDIDDPLFSGGITIETSCWKLMTTSYSEDLLKVEKKFSVRFEVEHRISQGKVRVRAVGGRNVALENHAVRALSRLYKRIVTSSFTTTQAGGATGFTSPDPPMNRPKWDRGEPMLNGQSGDSAVPKKAMVEAVAGGGDHKEDNCPICLDTFEEKRQLGCKHEFCHDCLDKAVKSLGPCCPVCKHVFGTMVGNQPKGTMTSTIIPKSLPGFPKCGTIMITYNIPSGMQTEKHPNPGKPFQGVHRKAYLPNNKEGKEVLQLLQQAFNQRLIFTVGQSRTSSAENQVTWNDIHHKTSMESGSTSFGYPDPEYLRRVRDELKAKGIE